MDKVDRKITLQRPGYTESGLCFLDYLESKDIQKPKYKLFLLKWLYSTSGFYDKNIRSYDCIFSDKKFHPKDCKLDIEEVANSEIYNSWLSLYKESIQNCEYLMLCLHKHISQEYPQEEKKYINSLSPKQNADYKSFWWARHECFYNLMENKKVLIVNGLSDLICNYYHSGFTHKYIPDFPKCELVSVNVPYSFFNTGPDNHAIDTIFDQYKKIQDKNFDTAIISYGSYGCILANMIQKNLKKHAITIGSGMNKLFALKNVSLEPRTLPMHYRMIENGRYWNFET